MKMLSDLSLGTWAYILRDFTCEKVVSLLLVEGYTPSSQRLTPQTQQNKMVQAEGRVTDLKLKGFSLILALSLQE